MKTFISPPRIALRALCAFVCAVATHAQVSQNIGTLEPGQSVTITYEVTINDPLSPAITQISSQGQMMCVFLFHSRHPTERLNRLRNA